MKLSVIIPCFNEIGTVKTILKRISQSGIEDQEVIVVDDGSTDGTREILVNELMEYITHLEFHEENQGKGVALRTGILKASGDIVIFQDADLEYDPQDYGKLIQPILDGKADVVYGSRFLVREASIVLNFWHRAGNWLFTLLSNMLTNLNLTDAQTCYKVMLKSIVDEMTFEEKQFGIDPEITAKLAKLKCRIYEVGITYNKRVIVKVKK